MAKLNPKTSLVTFVTPDDREEIISMILTVSFPVFQPYHFSNKTRIKKIGMAINKIFPYVSIS
jgi:hypothetical protein